MSIANVLINKREDIMRSAEAVAEHISDVQKIRDYLTRRVSEIQLTPKQQERLKIYDFIYSEMRTGKYIDIEIVNMVVLQFGCAKGAALQHLRDTQDLYSTALSVNKAFEIKLQLDLNKIMLQMAKAKGDFKSYAALEKNRIALIELVQEIEENNNDEFRGYVIEPVFDPELLGIVSIDKDDYKKLIKDIRGKYGNKRNENFEDAIIIEK